MAGSDTVLNPGSGGDTIRDVDKGGVKTQVVITDFGGDGAEDLTARPYGSGVTTSKTPRTVEADDSPVVTVLGTLTTPSDQQHVIIDSSASLAVTGPLTDGQLRATAVPTTVGNFPATQPVSGSVSVSNLPADQLVHATNLDVALSTRTKPSDQQHVIVDSSASIAVTGPLTDTQLRASAVPISAGSLPLPTLAATSTKQSDGSQKTQVVDGSGNVVSTTGNALDVNLKTPATVPVSAASLPLPTLAATSTKQSDGSQKSQIVDGSGNVIGATSNALDINIKSGNPTTITVTQATGTNLHTVVDSGVITSVTNAVTVAQATGTNLHTVVDSGTITTITNPVTVAQVTAANLNMTEASAAAIKTDADTLVTNTNPLVTAAAGGYVRQDSTATIAKESGGNLATIVTNTAPLVYAQGVAATSLVGPVVQAQGDDGSSPLPNYTDLLRLDALGRLLVNSNSVDMQWLVDDDPPFFEGSADAQFYDLDF